MSGPAASPMLLGPLIPVEIRDTSATGSPASGFSGEQCEHSQPRPQAKTKGLEEHPFRSDKRRRNGFHCRKANRHASSSCAFTLSIFELLATAVWRPVGERRVLKGTAYERRPGCAEMSCSPRGFRMPI